MCKTIEQRAESSARILGTVPLIAPDASVLSPSTCSSARSFGIPDALVHVELPHCYPERLHDIEKLSHFFLCSFLLESGENLFEPILPIGDKRDRGRNSSSHEEAMLGLQCVRIGRRGTRTQLFLGSVSQLREHCACKIEKPEPDEQTDGGLDISSTTMGRVSCSN